MLFDDVKVGDRFRDKQVYKVMTVTELTERGFNYDIEPYQAFPARYGCNLVTNGELLYKDYPELAECWSIHYEKL
ncbi:MAG: hypothetical protein ACREQ5_05670 [Candidatus Dormibacteria bacterium]